MKNLKNLNLEKIGIIAKTPKGKIIAQVCQDKEGNFFIMEVVSGSDFKHYYTYRILKNNLLKFLVDKDNSALVPVTKTIVKVHIFDNAIIETVNTKDIPLISKFEEEWECDDFQSILSIINI